VTAEQNLSDFTNFLALTLTSKSQLDVVQARDGTAIDTKKVGVTGIVIEATFGGFKPPHVVTDFGPAQQTGFRHVVEVAKSSGLIHTRCSQVICYGSVCQWRSRFAQQLQCSNSRRRGSQPRLANRSLDLVERFVIFGHVYFLNLTVFVYPILHICNGYASKEKLLALDGNRTMVVSVIAVPNASMFAIGSVLAVVKSM
jgi:hypothetical protein